MKLSVCRSSVDPRGPLNRAVSFRKQCTRWGDCPTTWLAEAPTDLCSCRAFATQPAALSPLI